MRNAFTVLSVAVMLAMGVSVAFAQPPVDGNWVSPEEFLDGRYSIAWPGANGYGDAGNLIHTESWDGGALGTQWRIYCPYIVNVTTLYYSDFGGGTVFAGYQIEYSGGNVWLDGSGPWAGGDASYSGVITNYTELRNLQIIAGTLTGLNSNHNLSATIAGYPQDCVQFAIGNTAWIGDTPQHGAKPAGYPAFLDASCDPNGTQGHWGTATDNTITVEGCSVGTEETTWGSVKSLYR